MSIAAFTFVALALFAKGFSPAHTGILLGILPVLQVVAQPVWGLAADVTGRTKSLVGCACVLLAVSSLVLWRAHHIGWLVAAIVGVAVGRSGILPLATTLALWHLGTRGRGFGRIRLWGSAGFAIAVLAVGWKIAAVDPSTVLAVHSLFAVVAAVTSVWLPAGTRQPGSVWGGRFRADPGAGLVPIMVAAALAGTGLGVNNSFLAVYVRDLGGPAWTLGAAFAVAAVGEIPLMAVMHRLIARVGTSRLVSLGFLALVVRWCLYAILPSVWPLLPLQLLHSVAIACLEVAGVLLVRDLSPQTRAATAQATYGAALMGLGPGVGTVVAGAVYDHYGSRAVFVASAVPALAAWVVYQRSGRRRREVAP